MLALINHRSMGSFLAYLKREEHFLQEWIGIFSGNPTFANCFVNNLFCDTKMNVHYFGDDI